MNATRFLALIIGAGDVVAAAEIEPFELAEIGRDLGFQAIPCAFERLEILFAQGVEMQAGYAFQMLRVQLADRKTQSRVRRAGVIFGDLALGMFGIDAQADIGAVVQVSRQSVRCCFGELKITWSEMATISAMSAAL